MGTEFFLYLLMWPLSILSLAITIGETNDVEKLIGYHRPPVVPSQCHTFELAV